ncbi:MAG: ATP-binding cassette domain-containing protein [Actinomycetota bacterium]|nr:ATP-binding cassette domain-containing protein [Actinomycetota bacterium]
MAAVEVRGLTKTFGSGDKGVRALDGLDLQVPEGTVLGLLGPNGAGKTTTVRVLTTLLPPDAGEARVLGHDVTREPGLVRRLIGLSGQYSAVDENLTGRENLWMFGRLYGLPSKAASARAGELLEMFDLAEARDRVTKTYSGGMKRRLDLAGALIAHPKVLFLDEPTTGLDPRARLDLWEVIRDRVRSGVTLLLTTQYLEEADALADSIAVIDHGQVIAQGTSDQLKSEVGGERIEVVVHDPARTDHARLVLARFALGGEVDLDEHARRLTLPSSGGSGVLVQVIRELDAEHVAIDDIGLRRPTLDDVFLSLTGHTAEQAVADTGDTAQAPEPAGRTA